MEKRMFIGPTLNCPFDEASRARMRQFLVGKILCRGEEEPFEVLRTEKEHIALTPDITIRHVLVYSDKGFCLDLEYEEIDALMDNGEYSMTTEEGDSYIVRIKQFEL